MDQQDRKDEFYETFGVSREAFRIGLLLAHVSEKRLTVTQVCELMKEKEVLSESGALQG